MQKHAGASGKEFTGLLVKTGELAQAQRRSRHND